MFEFFINSIFLLAILSALSLLVFTNPVHIVLSFILVVINLSLILFLLGFDFLGLVLIIVYIGAIIVLFLFIVMMLNIKILETNSTYWSYLPVGILISSLFFLELFYLLPNFTISSTGSLTYTNWIYLFNFYTSLESFGHILYSYYLIFFIYVSIILLLAMVGSIILTLNQNLQVKRQQIFFQREKKLWNAIKIYGN